VQNDNKPSILYRWLVHWRESGVRRALPETAHGPGGEGERLELFPGHDFVGFLDRLHFTHQHIRFEVQADSIDSRGIKLPSRHQQYVVASPRRRRRFFSHLRDLSDPAIAFQRTGDRNVLFQVVTFQQGEKPMARAASAVAPSAFNGPENVA
jgi:hypothetical protein